MKLCINPPHSKKIFSCLLLYRLMGWNITKKLMVKEKVQLPRTKLKLDRLSLVHIREKIENWEILKTYHLKD